MDCDVARSLLAYRRPSGPVELPAADAGALDQHLAGCSACAAAARKAAGFDAAVAAAMKAVPVPPGLRDRLVAAALARRSADVRWKGLKVVGLAAALLVTFGLAGGIYWAARPGVDTTAVADAAVGELTEPEAAVRKWLDAEGLPPALPAGIADLDYRHHTFHGRGELAGREVPVVAFAVWSEPNDRLETAKVYVLRGTRFDLRDLRDAQNSFANVQVFRDDKAGVAYLVVYTSESLDPFRRKAGPRMTRAAVRAPTPG